jgi:hypothetical protein
MTGKNSMLNPGELQKAEDFGSGEGIPPGKQNLGKTLEQIWRTSPIWPQ